MSREQYTAAMEETGRRMRAGTVSDEARALADTIDVRSTAGAVTEDIMSEVWADREEPGFHEAVDRSVHGNISAIFDIMGGRLRIGSAQPQQAIDLADSTAQLGIPAAELERAYRVGVASLWSQWFALAVDHSERLPMPLPPLIEGPSMAIMGYVDHILEIVVARYENVRSELHQTNRQLRRLLLLQILDGSITEATPDLDQRLAYSLSDAHVALLLQSHNGQVSDHDICELRDAADARSVLMFQHGPNAWVAWLGRPNGFGPGNLSRLRRALAQSNLTVACSEPASGLAGLRRSYREAVDTARVQHALGSAGRHCLWASDVRLEALLLGDEGRARQFVTDELGPLADSDALAQRLRETLLAWLSTGSHVGAAAMLGVHENTIRNRIRQAEDLLDAALVNRRTELQVALRLERVLHAGAGSIGDFGSADAAQPNGAEAAKSPAFDA